MRLLFIFGNWPTTLGKMGRKYLCITQEALFAALAKQTLVPFSMKNVVVGITKPRGKMDTVGYRLSFLSYMQSRQSSGNV